MAMLDTVGPPTAMTHVGRAKALTAPTPLAQIKKKFFASFFQKRSSSLHDQSLHRFQLVGFRGRFVGSNSQYSGKAQGNAGFVAG
jgi:hypothetical protein